MTLENFQWFISSVFNRIFLENIIFRTMNHEKKKYSVDLSWNMSRAQIAWRLVNVFQLWFQLMRQLNWAPWRNEEINIVNKLTRSIKSYLPIRCDFKECFLLSMHKKDWFHSMASKCIWFWFSEAPARAIEIQYCRKLYVKRIPRNGYEITKCKW